MLTNFLLGVPVCQKVDGAREETSFDAAEEEPSGKEALVVLGLREGNYDTAPDPDYGWEVD